MWFIGGVGHGTKNTLARTLIQERVPDRLHGRAFAAYNGMRNGAELVALGCGGLLVSAIGGRATLALAGGISVAVALVGPRALPAPACRPPSPSSRADVGERGLGERRGRDSNPRWRFPPILA